MKYTLLTITSLFAIAGCATSVVPTHETTPGTVLAPAMAHQTSGSVPVVFKRDAGMMGSMCAYRIFVNGAPTAELRPGQSVTVYVAPIKHIAGVRPGGICGGGDSELEFDATDRRSRTFRISIDHNGSVRLQPTAF